MAERRFDTRFIFDAIGTGWTVEYDAPSDVDREAVQAAVAARIDRFDRTYSRFRADSTVSHIASRAGTYELSSDAVELFDFYDKLYRVTGGKVTPLIGQTLSDAGYDAQYSLRPKATIRKPLRYDDEITRSGSTITVRRPVLLDVGAAGKGYLVDLVAGLLRDAGCTAWCVNAGGDMSVGNMSLDIGLENPDDTSQAVGIAHLRNGSLCGSAGNRRAWAGYTHMIDPVTLRSPRHIKAVWVAAGSTMLADGLTTALYFCDPDELTRHWTFEYAIINAEGKLRTSPGFPGKFF